MAHTAPCLQFHYTSSISLEVWMPPVRETPLYGVDVAVGVFVGVEVAVNVAVTVKVGIMVAGAVGGAAVKVAVGGWELCREIRGLIQSAKSSWEEPLARTDRINLTLSPLNVLRSMLIGYDWPS